MKTRLPYPRGARPRHGWGLAAGLSLTVVLMGCANPALRRADELQAQNQPLQALAVLDEALLADPQDQALRAARVRARDRTSSRLVLQIDALRGAGRYAEAQALLASLKELEPKHPRLAALQIELSRAQRQDKLLQEARQALQALQANKLELAEARLQEIAAESPRASRGPAVAAAVVGADLA